MADELERQRLVASSADFDSLVEQARAMLAASQPRRASMLLAAAEDKGARFLSKLRVGVADALNEAYSKRRDALAIEREVTTNSAESLQTRNRRLAKHGVSIGADGIAGRGARSSGARVGDREAGRVAPRAGRRPAAHKARVIAPLGADYPRGAGLGGRDPELGQLRPAAVALGWPTVARSGR